MRYSWHVKNWFRVGKTFSWRLSFNTLFAFIGLWDPLKNRFTLKRADSKHKYIINRLENEFSDLIEKYKAIDDKNINGTPNYTIWTLWWQGVDNAPPLVKACIESIEKNKGDASFVIITKDNYQAYIELPAKIVQMQQAGKLSMANMTDIIRLILLSKYGGLWLDATIFVSNPINPQCFTLPFYSLHTNYAYNCYVQHNLYHIFVLGSKPNGKLMSFTKNLFLAYFDKYETIIDYFLLDYSLMLAYKNFNDIKEEIDNLPFSSERLYDLVSILNKPFNKDYFNKLKKECTFSKLDWHKDYKLINKGEKTYYNVLTSSQ